MHPVVHDAMPGRTFRLGELGLMVGEDVVGASCMYVEPPAEQRYRHRRALDMPAGKARSPRTRPDLKAVFARCLPQGEVARMTLARIDLATRSGEELVDAVARQPSVGGEARDVVIHGAVHLVGMRL